MSSNRKKFEIPIPTWGVDPVVLEQLEQMNPKDILHEYTRLIRRKEGRLYKKHGFDAQMARQSARDKRAFNPISIEDAYCWKVKMLTAKQTGLRRKMAQAARDKVKVVKIVSSGKATLSPSQLEEVEASIVDKIFEMDKDAFAIPQFSNAAYMDGSLEVSCDNIYTVKWLQEIVTELPIPVRTVTEELYVGGEVIKGTFRDSTEYSQEKIFALLEVQNQGVDTTAWKVLGCTSDVDYVCLKIMVDRASFEQISNMSNELFYRFSTVKFFVVTNR